MLTKINPREAGKIRAIQQGKQGFLESKRAPPKERPLIAY
jgi:hypothetical protein